MRLNKALDLQMQQAVEAAGYEYIGGELEKSGRNTLIRIYIDAPNGVTIDDCAVASNQISHVLDVEDPFANAYRLEVSSPGLERPLFKIEHYQEIIGHFIKVKLRHAVEGRRNFKGILQAVIGNIIELEIDARRYKLDYADIEKANLCVD